MSVLAAIQIAADTWRVHEVNDAGERIEKPVGTLTRDGADGWILHKREGSVKHSVRLVGSLEGVLTQMGDALFGKASRRPYEKTMFEFYGKQLEVLNVLAVKTETLPPLISAISEAIADFLYEDVKPEGRAEILQSMATEIAERLKSRGLRAELVDALKGLLDALAATIGKDGAAANEAPPPDAPKH